MSSVHFPTSEDWATKKKNTPPTPCKEEAEGDYKGTAEVKAAWESQGSILRGKKQIPTAGVPDGPLSPLFGSFLKHIVKFDLIDLKRRQRRRLSTKEGNKND